MRTARASLFWTILTAAGCSSGSGQSGLGRDAGSSAVDSGIAAVTTASCAGSTFAWNDDGVPTCAPSAEAIVSLAKADSGSDSSLEVVGTYSTTVGISFALSVPNPIAGTYACTPTGPVEFTYHDAAALSTTVQDCMVTVSIVPGDTGGMHATGTFSATLKVPSGATKALTDGHFDLPTVSE